MTFSIQNQQAQLTSYCHKIGQIYDLIEDKQKPLSDLFKNMLKLQEESIPYTFIPTGHVIPIHPPAKLSLSTEQEFKCTIEAWVKPEISDNDEAHRCILNGQGNAHKLYPLCLGIHKKTFAAGFADGSRYFYEKSGDNALSLRKWNYIVAVFDGNECKLSLNNISVISSTYSVADDRSLNCDKTVFKNKKPLDLTLSYLGRALNPNAFNGHLQIRVWNGIRSPSEQASDMYNPCLIKDPALAFSFPQSSIIRSSEVQLDTTSPSTLHQGISAIESIFNQKIGQFNLAADVSVKKKISEILPAYLNQAEKVYHAMQALYAEEAMLRMSLYQTQLLSKDTTTTSLNQTIEQKNETIGSLTQRISTLEANQSQLPALALQVASLSTQNCTLQTQNNELKNEISEKNRAITNLQLRLRVLEEEQLDPQDPQDNSTVDSFSTMDSR